MEALEDRLLALKESARMMMPKDERSQITSPNWYLAHAASMQDLLEKADVKPSVLLTDSQMILKNELDLIKAQLHAQTKAFQALSHSITLLEQESNHQQIRIKQLEEEVQFASHSTHGETFDDLVQRRIQEVWRVMAKEVEGLQGSMVQKESSVESLSREVLESKTFLWEELEAVQAELRRIHQKLKDQEVDITRNLVSIKKMQENQIKCTKILSQLRGKNPEYPSEKNKLVSEELNDIWSAVNTLRNTVSDNMWTDKRGPSRIKGRGSRHHRKANVPGSIFSDSAVYPSCNTREQGS
ncbi:coiled-coil domain-containing protein 159 isoform X1 [Anolis carolinensis]|nr:PREDICTED: coiled-coil domain-containing protein 159 [Anolis carolinensis]|eukprot:XP_008123761.1 PREDICTED: coiled-coil domain-containing protein 159 [Anolis carolinensis]